MNEPKNQKFENRVVLFGSIAIALVAGASFGFLYRLGVGANVASIGTNALQKSGAMIAGTWQNLFGSATYDVSPDENASDSLFFSDTASSSEDLDDTNENDTLFSDGSAATSSLSTPSTPKNQNLSQNNTQDNSSSGNDTDENMELGLEISSSSNNADQGTDTSPNNLNTNTTHPACTFPSALAAASSSSQSVIINEIAWMGSPPAPGESAAAAANDEWIELKNISSGTIGLENWTLMDAGGAINIIFDSDDAIPANGFLLLARGTTSGVAQSAAIHYAGGLSNVGDRLVLLDAMCDVADFIDASSGWPGGNNTTKQTLERAADHVDWQTSAPVGGTPGAENSFGALATGQSSSTASSSASSSIPSGSGASGSSGSSSPPSGGVGTDSGDSGSDTNTSSSTEGTTSTASTFCPADHVVIAQIQIAGGSSSNDFIKLYNPGTAAVDISGWKLRKKTSGGTDSSVKVIPASTTIASNAYFTWANSANGFAESIGADTSSSQTLAADNSVAILDASGTIVDEVAWGTGTNQYGEGNPFPTSPAANQILERIFLNGAIGDSDDNATDFTLH